MQKIFFLCFTVLLFGKSYTQITVTNTTFPILGDTLKTVVNNNFKGTLNMGNVAGPQVWDFSMLNSGTKQNEIFLNPSKGKDASAFPDATMLLIAGTQEQYLKSSPTKIEVLGYGGQNPIFGVPLVVKFTKRPVYRAAPLNFITSTTSTSEFKVDLSTNIIPDTLLAGLPLKPDSLRILFTNTSKGLFDGFGSLKMQNKTYDVLREKSESISETKLLVKVFGIWLDPSTLFGGNLPGGIGGFLGKDTTITYNFYSNQKKEILVSADYNTRNLLQSVTFADLGGITSATSEVNIAPQMSVYPNPADQVIHIAGIAGKDSKYLISIADLTGRIVHFETALLYSGELKDIQIGHFTPGVYVVSIIDQFRSSVSSVRFVKK
jgi:hypothetical protein